MLLLTAPNIAICLALTTTAFMISTIFLAVEKADLKDDLDKALNKLDEFYTVPTTLPTTLSTTLPTTVTAPSTASSTVTASTSSTTSPGTAANPPNTTPSSTASPTTVSTQSTRTTAGIIWPTETVTATTITAVTSNPNYPTLPTGLPDPEEIIYRLPTEIRPVKYRLYWHPNFDTNTCEGSVTVQVEVDVPTNLIVMHSKDLEINGISILNVMAYMRIRVKSFYLSEERELLIIELEELLRTSTPYVVNVDFICQLTGLNGMYSSVYKDEANEER